MKAPSGPGLRLRHFQSPRAQPASWTPARIHVEHQGRASAEVLDSLLPGQRGHPTDEGKTAGPLRPASRHTPPGGGRVPTAYSKRGDFLKVQTPRWGPSHLGGGLDPAQFPQSIKTCLPSWGDAGGPLSRGSKGWSPCCLSWWALITQSPRLHEMLEPTREPALRGDASTWPLWGKVLD